MKTGRDVVIAALLGAEEFGFATAPLVVSGCIMMRVCHLDTCPVGVATQNPVLRERFTGKAEFVVNFFEFIAEEVRELLAELGFRTIEEAIGHAELLDTAGRDRPLEGLRPRPRADPARARARRRRTAHCTKRPGPRAGEGARQQLIVAVPRPPSSAASRSGLELPIRNVNRTVGTMLGHEVTKRYGGEGLPDGTIDLTFTGSAGQSFGAFLPRGITLRLEGDANDYVGKGLSGRPDRGPPRSAAHASSPRQQIIAGNVIALRRDRRRGVPARPRRRAVLRPQLRGHRGRRGRRRPRLRVHDRRARRRPRPDRAQLRGRHVRRHRLRARPRPTTGSTRRWSTSTRSTTRTRDELDAAGPRHHAEETGSTVAEALLADWDAGADPLHQDHAPRLQARPSRSQPRPRPRPRRRRDRRAR